MSRYDRVFRALALTSPAAYKAFKTAMNRWWVVTPQYPDAQPIRSCIWKLTIDAEFFAVLNDSEGFCDGIEMWQQYAYLRQAIDLGQ
jgi:hypothetical protein